MDDNDKILVCDKCLRACCIKGEFMCEESKFANTVYKTRKYLESLDLEHYDYWKAESER